jgi:hypothetical protein
VWPAEPGDPKRNKAKEDTDRRKMYRKHAFLPCFVSNLQSTHTYFTISNIIVEVVK